MSPLHSQRSTNKGVQNQKWLPHPCLLGGPQEGGNAMSPLLAHESPKKMRTKSELATSPLHSQGPQTKGDKIRIGYVTPTSSRAQKRAQGLCHPLHSRGVPKQRKAKSKGAPSPLTFQGPTSGRKCYVTPAFSGVQKRADMLRQPLHSLGSTNKGGKHQKWLPQPAFSEAQKGRKRYVTSAFSGVPKQKGTKSKAATSPFPFGGPKDTKGDKIRILHDLGGGGRKSYLGAIVHGASTHSSPQTHPRGKSRGFLESCRPV